MQFNNIEELENLSLYCQICGFVIVMLGIFIIGTSLMKKHFDRIQTGVFLIATGYAQVKISQKIVRITQDEKRRNRSSV